MEAVVEEGGLICLEGVPFEAGRRIKITLQEETPGLTQEEWRAHLRKYAGSLPDFEIEEFDRNYPDPVEPLFLAEDRSEP